MYRLTIQGMSCIYFTANYSVIVEITCIKSNIFRCIEEMIEYEEDLPKIKQPSPVKK